MLIFFMEMRVMLSFSPLAVEQLSDSPELPGFWGSSGSLFFRHLNLRLTTLTRMITTTTRITMKLMTPKAATVSTVSDVGLGRMVESPLVLRLMVADLVVTFGEVSRADMCCCGWDGVRPGKLWK